MEHSLSTINGVQDPTKDPRNWRHMNGEYEVALFQCFSPDGKTGCYFDQEDFPENWRLSFHDPPTASSQYGRTWDHCPSCGALASDFDPESVESVEAKAAAEILSRTEYRIYRHQFLPGKLRGCVYFPPEENIVVSIEKSHLEYRVLHHIRVLKNYEVLDRDMFDESLTRQMIEIIMGKEVDEILAVLKDGRIEALRDAMKGEEIYQNLEEACRLYHASPWS